MTIFVSVTSNTPLSNWYDEVLPFIPGVGPGPLADKAIIGGAIELCSKSKCWEIDHPAINLVAGTSTYNFAPGTGMLVVQPINVWVSGVEIDPGSPTDFDALIPDWRAVSNAPARGYYCPDEDTIRIVPTPSASIAGGLTMRVAVKPIDGYATILNRFWNHMEYRDAITNSALASLYSMMNVPWSNPVEAESRRMAFMACIGKLDAMRAKGRSRRPMRSVVVHGVE